MDVEALAAKEAYASAPIHCSVVAYQNNSPHLCATRNEVSGQTTQTPPFGYCLLLNLKCSTQTALSFI